MSSQSLSTDTSRAESHIQHGQKKNRLRLVLVQQMSMINTLMKSLNCIIARFNSNSLEQQRSQRFGVTKSQLTLFLLRKPLRYLYRLLQRIFARSSFLRR